MTLISIYTTWGTVEVSRKLGRFFNHHGASPSEHHTAGLSWHENHACILSSTLSVQEFLHECGVA